MKPLDLLLLAPLEEEAWACKRWFQATETNLPLDIEWMHHPSGLSIALYYFNAMGSVTAAIASLPVIEHYRPKSVILLGIAAGRRRRFKIGYVGYNKYIYYCSYGKITGRKDPTYRAASLPQDGTLGDLASKVKATAWAQVAKAWWETSAPTWPDQFGCGTQLWPEHELHALDSDVASGELVVASDTYQKKVQERFPAAGLNMFEMEAYAVASICDKFKTPFLTVRGVSDYGTTSKDSTEKDAHRLCATLVSSAYVEAMVKCPDFGDRIKSLVQNPARAVVPCLLPKVLTPCPSKQRCVDTGIQVDAAQRAYLTSAFENVTFHEYSTSLGKRLREMNGYEKVTFLFPYSPRDLLKIIGRKSDAVDLARGVNKAIIAYEQRVASGEETSDLSGEIASKLKQIAAIGRRHFKHFITCEQVCEQLVGGLLNGDRKLLPLYMSRIVIVSDDTGIETSPLNLLYTYFLGEIVPTFWIREAELVNEVIDDITFFEQHGAIPPVENDSFNWLKAVRFFPKSRLLVATGWPCVASGLKEKGQRKLTHISGLYRQWHDEILAHATQGASLKRFREMPNGVLRQRFENVGAL